MYKTFAPETMKKIEWVVGMFTEWRTYHNEIKHFDHIYCDLNDKEFISQHTVAFAMCRFLTKIKKLDGSDFPPKTLRDIVLCVQFHLELLGFCYKLIDDFGFHKVCFTLDNLMKQHTQDGLGNHVQQADVI